MQELSFLDFVSSHLWSLKYAFFFLIFMSLHARVSARRLSVSSDASRHRIIRAPMRQIREGVLVAAQRSVERSDMGGAVRVFVKEGRRGGGAFKDGSTVSAICCEKADEKNIQSAGCWRKTEWHQRSAGAGTTLARGIGHKCYQAASGDMRTLSPSSPSYHCLLCLGRIKASQRPDVLVLEEQVLGGQWKFTVPWAVLGKSSEVSGDICHPRRGHHQVTGANTSKVPVCKI